MKNKFALAAALGFVVACGVMLASCETDWPDNPFLGTWASVGGDELTIAEQKAGTWTLAGPSYGFIMGNYTFKEGSANIEFEITSVFYDGAPVPADAAVLMASGFTSKKFTGTLASTTLTVVDPDSFPFAPSTTAYIKQ
jgi:hypothetical protein